MFSPKDKKSFDRIYQPQVLNIQSQMKNTRFKKDILSPSRNLYTSQVNNQIRHNSSFNADYTQRMDSKGMSRTPVAPSGSSKI